MVSLINFVSVAPKKTPSIVQEKKPVRGIIAIKKRYSFDNSRISES